MYCRFDMYTCITEEDTLFTKYRPTRGMNIHIYNYLKHNICLTKTKIQLHILITCHLYAQCGGYVLIHPAMIYVSYKYDDK